MKTVKRLFDQIQPAHYRIDLDIDMKVFGFTGRETIEFELAKASRKLVFHAAGFKVAQARLADGQVAKITSQTNDQTVTFTFGKTIPAGRHTLKLELQGTVGDSLHGLYRSTYQQDGQDKQLVTSQFEAVHAREAFVCIDEPAAKAVFEFALTVPDSLVALSNTDPVSVSKLAKGRKRVEFAPTPKMSTYLAYLGVGEFEHIEGATKRGTVVRVLATPGKLGQLAFALETGIRCLEFYEDYFAIAYPLGKLDMIAVPDFGAGAMENWGAVTYRDTALLLDPAKTSLAQKQRVAEVIAHELAHQWFGNLVTMEWWNDLWLNEGFASWIEVLAQDHLFPEWDVWTQFIVSDLERAQGLDALANTHPIEVEVNDPAELDGIFDAISYSKGASIINMLHSYLGAEMFRDGLRHYLTQHQYGNTVTGDLWQALEIASGQPVTQVMSAWTKTPGYPVLEFDGAVVRQRRFYSSPREAARATGREVWPVPVSFAGTNMTTQLVSSAEERLTSGPNGGWFKPNPGQTGFYRTLYTPAMLAALKPALQSGELDARDRVGIVQDIVATTEAGLTSSQVLLELVATLRNETNYAVWSALADGLGGLLAITDDETLRRQLEQFGAWFVQPNLERLGWEPATDESAFDTLLRPLVLRLAARFELPAVLKEAKHRFTAFAAGKGGNPDLYTAIFYAVARTGDATQFNQLLELYRNESIPQLKLNLLSALCNFRQPELVDRVLKLSLSKEVREQNLIYVVAGVGSNREGREAGWQFVQDNWTFFLERFGDGGHMLDYFVKLGAGGFVSAAKAGEVQSFFAAHPHPAITRAVAQTAESILLKADWDSRDHEAIGHWLTNWHSGHKA